jgi:D-tyrosyl-tRNA(Tyr) deacylase
VRVLFQRVIHACVRVDGKIVGGIGCGALLLVGIGKGDSEEDLRWMARKVCELRVFPDERGRFDRSVIDSGGGLLSVSQFTLYGDCRKGRRPSFVTAEDPARAEELHQRFSQLLREEGAHRVESGIFGASMQVELMNDGPVTLWLESPGESER